MGPGRLGDPDPGSFHRRIRFLPRVQKTNPRRKPGGEAFGPTGPGPLLLILASRKRELFQVTLQVLADPGHDESADAIGLDAKAVTGLDPGRGGDRPRDRYLVVRGHLCSPHYRRFAVGMQLAI